MSSDETRQPVEVRTWPEQTDLMVIAENEAKLLGHYPLLFDPARDGVKPSPIYDPFASFDERAEAAIAALESDQPFLAAHFNSPSAICLDLSTAARDLQSEILTRYGLDHGVIELGSLREAELVLDGLELEQVFALLVEWHDVVELHYPPGASVADPESWVHRAAPANSHLFHNLSQNLEQSSSDAAELAEAYEFFRILCNPSLAEFSFGSFLRWHYYHRSEFAAVGKTERFELRALAEAAEFNRS